MTSVPQCEACIHLDRDAPPGEYRCAAFPVDIPIPIQANKHDHSEPYPGDHGIRYEQIRPGDPVEVGVWAILTKWRRSGPQTENATAPAAPRKTKRRRGAAR